MSKPTYAHPNYLLGINSIFHSRGALFKAGTKFDMNGRCCHLYFGCGGRTVFYGQYKCTGAGAGFAGRVSWSRELTDEEAKPFISLGFIDGSEWIKL